MVELAHIVPTAFLKKFHRTKYHLTLAHMTLQDEKYREFYWNCSQKGEAVISDTSTFELNEPLPSNDLLKARTLLNADILVCPDYPSNRDRTYRETIDFIRIAPKGVKIMAIPQGNDYLSFYDCYLKFCEDDRIDIIGFPHKTFSNVYPKVLPTFRRLLFLERLRQCRLLRKPIHLLGLADNPIEIKLISSAYPICDYILGFDTSSAFVHGMKGIRFDSQIGMTSPKCLQKLDFTICKLTRQQVKDIEHNMKVIESWVK